MAISNVALKAYDQALKTRGEFMQDKQSGKAKQAADGASFMEAINGSLQKVNNLQAEKSSMIESFASGEKQNVHELMITLQKASTAMSMTSAVRTKVMHAYKEIMQTHF
jgi:flagellar hook-basal body complex protein FliE